MRHVPTSPRNKKLIVAILLTLLATTCLCSAHSIGGFPNASQYAGRSPASVASAVADVMGPSVAVSFVDRLYSIFSPLVDPVLTDGATFAEKLSYSVSQLIQGALADGATFSDKISYTVSQLIQGALTDGASFSDQISYLVSQPIQSSPADGAIFSDNISFSVGSSQNGSAPVSSGSVSTQRFPVTGISVSISGTAGTTGSVNTWHLTAQPADTGPVPLGSAGGGGLGFYDLSLSGITGGTAHACISSALVDSKTVLDFYSAGSWTEAAAISDTAATSTAPGTVCGDIAVSALTGTPLAIGDPQSGAAISTASTSGTPSTTSGPATTSGSSSPSYLIYIGGVVVLVIAIAAFLVLRRR